ncbi:MAG: hypothetical protein AAF414_04715 [Pseudomonadota bacterium]
MKTLIIAAATAFAAFTFAATGAIAQSTVPNIVGYWDSVETSGATYEGLWEDQEHIVHLEITEQDGYAFIGHFRWSIPDLEEDHLHDGTGHTNEAEETIVGVFTGSGASFVIAEHPDTGYMFGQVLDDNRLEIIQFESGEFALVFRDIYERRQ